MSRFLDRFPTLSPRGLMRLHATLTVAWALFIAPVLLLPGWTKSVPLLVFISLYANIASHFAAYQATRVEVIQDESST